MGALDCVSPTGKISATESTEVFAINLPSTTTLNEPTQDLEAQTKLSTKRRLWWALGVDLPLFIIVALVLGLFELNVIPSHQAGFFCNDPDLSYKFTGDTVSMQLIMTTVIFLPLLFIFPTECIFSDPDDTAYARAIGALKQTMFIYRSYLFGMFLNLGVVEVMKGVTGKPRPTFFDICEPDTGKTCTGSEYVSNFTCTSTKYSSWFRRDASHSFPSGHTSLSVYCGFFIAWYLQRRAFEWSHRVVLVVPALQLAGASYAAVSSLSRLTDHRHHPADVLVGAVVGVVTLYYAVVVLCDNFSYTKSRRGKLDEPSVRTLLYDERRRDVS